MANDNTMDESNGSGKQDLELINKQLKREIAKKKKIEQELIKAQKVLTASLKEKEILLKEIHHRVKNNLQIVNSLMSLQMNHVEDPKILKLFQECQNRIISMSLIHEQLYRSDDLASINLKDYLDLLTDRLRALYDINNKVEIQVELSGDQINLDTLIPISLILNEVISNSFKHAFAGVGAPRIDVRLEKEEHQYMLTIADNGTSFDVKKFLEESNSLGFELIKALVEQIDGEIELQSHDGTSCTIRFDA